METLLDELKPFFYKDLFFSLSVKSKLMAISEYRSMGNLSPEMETLTFLNDISQNISNFRLKLCSSDLNGLLERIKITTENKAM